MRIQILLFDGFDELDALGPFDVLHAGIASGADLRVGLVRLQGASVTSTHGLQFHVVARLEPDDPPDLLLLPGGGWLADVGPGTWAEAQCERIGAVVAAAMRSGATVAGVSTGVMFLAAAGLLRGRPATTNAEATDGLRGYGATLVSERVVDDGDLITCGGMASGLDLALWLLERFASAEVARTTEQRLGYERRGGVWRRSA